MIRTIIVSFSGGRTSAYMAKWLLDNKSEEYMLRFVFMNTGLEDEETLIFVNKCDKEWGLNLTWLECKVDPVMNVGTGYTVVSFETACRDERLFEDVVRKYGIPNNGYLHCNRELKLRPYEKYTKDNFGRGEKGSSVKTAIGIRADEIDRISPKANKEGLIYPLVGMNPTMKYEVMAWWSKQSFDLNLPEHRGNCVTCWKKSDRKLMTLSLQDPKAFDYFRRFEKEYASAGRGEGDRVFFRSGPEKLYPKGKTTDDIFNMAKEPFEIFIDGTYKGEIDNEHGCGREQCDLFS